MNCDSGNQQSTVKQEEDSPIVAQIKFEPDTEPEEDMKEEETNYQGVKKEIPWSEIVATTSHIQKFSGRLLRMNCDSGSQQSTVKQEEDSLIVAQIKCEPDSESVGNRKEEETNYQNVKMEIPCSEIVATTSHIEKSIKNESVDEIETKDIIASKIVVKVESKQDWENFDNHVEEKVWCCALSLPGSSRSVMNEEESVNVGKTCSCNILTYNVENTLQCHIKDKLCKCDICMKSFSQKTLLTQHLSTYTGKKTFKCKVCSKSFSCKLNLAEHSRTHTISNEKPFKCAVCSKSFSKKSHMTDHSRTHTNEKPFKCDVCSKSFSQKSHLTQHSRTHTNEKSFKCDICSKLFSQKSHLRLHSRTHTNEKPFKCNICSKSFSQKSHMTGHSHTHANEKPFKCYICSKSFAHKSNLTLHLRAHTNEKPFKCNVCSKSFSQKPTLTLHSLSHANERPFKCYVCSKLFSKKSHLTKHSHTHTNEKPFKCDFCSKSFSQKSHMTNHSRTHTKENLSNVMFVQSHSRGNRT